MSNQPETPKYTPGRHPHHRCPECGLWVMDLDFHDCGEEQDFDGTCPMCGEWYRSFLDHLEQCDGG